MIKRSRGWSVHGPRPYVRQSLCYLISLSTIKICTCTMHVTIIWGTGDSTDTGESSTTDGACNDNHLELKRTNHSRAFQNSNIKSETITDALRRKRILLTLWALWANLPCKTSGPPPWSCLPMCPVLIILIVLSAWSPVKDFESQWDAVTVVSCVSRVINDFRPLPKPLG